MVDPPGQCSCPFLIMYMVSIPEIMVRLVCTELHRCRHLALNFDRLASSDVSAYCRSFMMFHGFASENFVSLAATDEYVKGIAHPRLILPKFFRFTQSFPL